MCGICGAIGIQDAQASEAALRKMTAAMLHRGPDDDGFLVSPPVAVGIRRLSIIDVAGGHQPIWNESHTLAVVCNGEIYNFRELRRELEAQGHQFRTNSDVEVIVHGYESWGAECLQRLRGMFAFALLELPRDAAQGGPRVFIARDRLGIKPLYYALVDGALLFASEVRALLASGLVAPRLSTDALESFLLFGSVSEPTTLIEEVFSLPPGHSLSVSASPDEPVAARPARYWDFPGQTVRAPGVQRGSGQSPARILRAHLEDAVRRHLIADVPLGIFLSSGVDSTALAALASREQCGMRTFTVAFTEQDFSEAQIARRTAKRLGADHCEYVLTGEEMRARVGEAVAALDQPSMDGVNTYFVSWAARQSGLKVALSGLGSDEIFGGYSTFQSARQLARLAAAGRWIPERLRTMAAPILARAQEHRGRWDAGRKLAAAFASPDALPHPYFFTRALFSPEKVSHLMGQDSRSAQQTFSPWAAWLDGAVGEARALDGFSAVSWLELRTYMVNTLLRDTDAMSMSHSLEVRVPFLDHSLVEFALGLPEREKRRAGRPKHLLIEALGDLLPPEVVAQKKRTFTLPWENWLRGPLRATVETGLGDLAPALAATLSGEAIDEVWQDFIAGRTSWSRVWALYVLNEWVRAHVDASAGRGAGRSAVDVGSLA